MLLVGLNFADSCKPTVDRDSAWWFADIPNVSMPCRTLAGCRSKVLESLCI